MFDRHTGTVRRISQKKGFGFIQDHTGLPDHFFHVSGVLQGFKEMSMGDRVSFTSTRTIHGFRAEDVEAA